jgi:molybdopterin-guanine dinucleotide biosynthesis protein A/rhodanese-related sulfurtransferase
VTDAFTGVVLTGGGSTRMGRDKSLIEIDGLTLAQRVAAALAEAGAVEVFAVGGDRDGLLAQPAITRWIADSHPGEGPLDGLITALRAAPTDEVVVLACDTPLIDADVPRRLLAALRAETGSGVAVAVVDGRDQPLTAAWRRSQCLDDLEESYGAGERAPRRVFPRLSVAYVHGLPAEAVADVDRPDDLDRYHDVRPTAEVRGPVRRGSHVIPVTEIDIDGFEALLDTGVVLIDVREDDEYADGHVEGAHLMSLSAVPERVGEIPTDTTVYVICAVGGRSGKAVEFLRAQGIDAVNVTGGTNAWVNSGRPVVTGPAPA